MKIIYKILLLAFLFISCKKEKTTITNISSGSTWKEHVIEYSGDYKILLNSYMTPIELRIFTPTLYITLPTSTATIDGDFYTQPLGDGTPLEYKPALNKTLIAYWSQEYPNSIIIDDARCTICGYNTTININGWASIPLKVNQGYLYNFSQYYSYNFSYDIGALNADNFFMTSVKKKGSDNIVMLMERCDTINIYSNSYLITVDSTSIKNISLPESNSQPVRRMESFNKNFFVSTANNSYLVREDGSYKQIVQKSASDYFIYNGITYADFGDYVLSSTDDGENWTLVANNLGYSAFRQFAQVDSSLVFYKDDSLFVANANNFSYKKISNTGLQTNKITSVSASPDSVYVTTLSGLFVKHKKYLLK